MLSLISKSSIILALVVNLAACQDNQMNESNLNIVGGSSPETQFYYARLEGLKGTSMATCGASFLTKRILLTAAHCVDDLKGTNVQVRLGTDDITKTDEILKVDSVIVHENWNSKTTENDIAIIRVENYDEQKLSFKIKPIEMSKNINDNWNQKLRAIGTGVITSIGNLSEPVLKQIEVPHLPIKECQDVILNKDVAGRFPSIDDRNLCVNAVENGGQGVCYGDSGGPLTALVNNERVLVGVASWVLGKCAQKEEPGIFTRVSFFESWIEEKIAFLSKPPRSLEDKIDEYFKVGCFNKSYKRSEKIGNEDTFAVLGMNLTPGSFTKTQQNLKKSDILKSFAGCELDIPGEGKMTTGVLQLQDESFKFFIFGQSGQFLADAKTSIKSVTTTCDSKSPSQLKAVFDSQGRGGILSVGKLNYTLLPTHLSKEGLTNSRTSTDTCVIDNLSVSYYKIITNGEESIFVTVDGKEFGLSQKVVFLALEAMKPALFSSKETKSKPEFVALIESGAQTSGSIQIKNLNQRGLDLHTWDLTCNKKYILTDTKGNRLIPQELIYKRSESETINLYQYRFEAKKSPHGSIKFGESVKFEIEANDALEKIQCQINGLPLYWATPSAVL